MIGKSEKHKIFGRIDVLENCEGHAKLKWLE